MFMGLYGVAEFGTIDVTHGGRSAGFGDPHDYASYLVLFIPLFLSFFMETERENPKLSLWDESPGLFNVKRRKAFFSPRGGSHDIYIMEGVTIQLSKTKDFQHHMR